MMISSGIPGSTEGDFESHEDRFACIVALPSLQKIASCQAALSVWYSYVSGIRASDDFKSQSYDSYDTSPVPLGLGDGYQDACYPMIESLNTPRRIEILLKESFDEVLKEIRKWINHLNSIFDIRFLHFSQQCIRSFDPKYFHWFPNGKINYKTTAANMVRGNSGLNAMAKFIFMSKYCLEDEMKKFSLLWLPREYISSVNFNGEYLIYYWICYLKHELHNIPSTDFDCVDAAMAAKCDSSTWIAFEYFWDRLSVSDQISVAKVWLHHLRIETCLSQDRLLNKMSLFQQRVLLSEIPKEIIFNFFVNLESPEAAFWAWTHSKDIMSVEQFNDLMDILKLHRKTHREETERFCLLIWDTVPDHLKNEVVRCIEERIEVLFSVVKPSATDFALLCKYAPLKSSQFWRHLILNNVSHFANYTEDPCAMIDFVESCLVDPDDLAEFKRSLTQSDKMMFGCLRLISGGNLEYIDLKLKFCYSDEKAVREYKENVLTETRVFEKGVYFTDLRKWAELSEFIDDMYADDPSTGLHKKKHFISLYAGVWPHKNDRVDSSKIDDMIKIVEMVFAKEELPAIKKVFVRSFLKLRANRSTYWRDKFTDNKFFLKFVVGWCLAGDQKAIDEFKTILPVEIIFDEIISKLDREYVKCFWLNSVLLTDVDCFLKWYLNSDEMVRRYKAARITRSDGLKIFDSVALNNDKSSLMVLLKWAFNGDVSLAKRSIQSGNLKNAMRRLGIF
ncbi:uncharacterized protein LOC135845683 isoform X2 [Planococcus citri]|uniref:uncharacterized protein LOC135845683 isoform X2 n=1 Tax=Planococcus citri TaxID=170843 RepID=UPI0031F9D8CC